MIQAEVKLEVYLGSDLSHPSFMGAEHRHEWTGTRLIHLLCRGYKCTLCLDDN